MPTLADLPPKNRYFPSSTSNASIPPKPLLGWQYIPLLIFEENLLMTDTL
ncbi:hypothetical protein JYQ62_31730 [Nostoc sp. UHCC 0702]|nr:hypothetical protein JYQ62_31730 [Nostoc sp. UHCC 0702]